jgi:hypothetical protein
MVREPREIRKALSQLPSLKPIRFCLPGMYEIHTQMVAETNEHRQRAKSLRDQNAKGYLGPLYFKPGTQAPGHCVRS